VVILVLLLTNARRAALAPADDWGAVREQQVIELVLRELPLQALLGQLRSMSTPAGST
jgi:hypothetical protein